MANGYLIQGLRDNTLVAGKTTALRLVTAPWPAAAAASVVATVVRADGSVLQLEWTPVQFVVVDVGTARESIVVLIAGRILSQVGVYYIRANILTGIGGVAASYLLDNVQLYPTKDLRMMVNRCWSNTGPAAKAGEVQAAQDAMERLSWLYPLRDGIGPLDGQQRAGLRFFFDDNPQGPPNQDGGMASDTVPVPLWDPYQSPAPGKDSLDVALIYRFPDVGEPAPGFGARSLGIYNGWLPRASIVWQGPLGHAFSHETGHLLGLVPKESPHFDPSGQAAHSRDEFIEASDAADGFDIQFNQPFPTQVFDLMFPTSDSPGPPLEASSLSAWDWEYVRLQLLKKGSTGPPGPSIRWQSLGGVDLRAYPCAARNQDGRLEVFVLGGDRSLYHIWETQPGEWGEWDNLKGVDLVGPILAAANADGRLQVFVRDEHGSLLSRSQTVPNGTWDPWTTLEGSDVKGFAVARSGDRKLEVAAVFGNGALYENYQLAPNGAWNGWVPLGGESLNGPVALAPNADGRLTVLVVGGDNRVYGRSQLTPKGGADWGDWTRPFDAAFSNVVDLRAERAADGRLHTILMTATKSLALVRQAAPNGAWEPSIDMYGHDLRWPCGLGKGDDGRLEVMVIGGDEALHGRWQVDPDRTDVWANWTPLGGRKIRPGVAMEMNSEGRVEFFVVGGDGALYRGFRLESVHVAAPTSRRQVLEPSSGTSMP